jgi:3',5'-cyclic-AMP phosphodiesterase
MKSKKKLINKIFRGFMQSKYIKKRVRKETIGMKIGNWTISIVLAAMMLCGLNAYSAQDSLKFVQLSDVHFSTLGQNTTFKLTGDSPKLFDDAIGQINEMENVSFVMFTGDLIDKPFEKQLRAFLEHAQNIKYPWYFAFGNHDTCVGGYLTSELYRNIVKNSNANYTSDKNYYSFEPQKGYKVIVLDSIIRNRITANGEIQSEQLKWLDNELKASKDDIVLIFTHVPIVEPFSSPNHRMNNANDVRAVIEKYKNPIAVFQGHYHASKIRQFDNVIYVNSPALVSYPDAFRVVTVTNHKNSVTFDIRTRNTRELNLQKAAKIMTFSSNLYEGEAKDRNTVLTIKK